MTEQQLTAMRQALEALIAASGHVNNEVFVKVMMARDALNDAFRTAIEKLETAEFHSAEYWKGHDDAVRGVAMRWEEALTAPIPKAGVISEPLEFLYRRTEALRTAIEQAETAQGQEMTLQKQLDEALSSLDFYKRRVDALQQWQSKMRDPERTIVCDILANGHTLEPAGNRYNTPPAAPVQDSDHEFKNFHRVLCERFGYTHDEIDWKRDQVSLIEWIAKQTETAQGQGPVMRRTTREEKIVRPGIYEVMRDVLNTTPPAAQPAEFVCSTGLCHYRKPLTDEQLVNLIPDDDTPMSLGEILVKFARAIEAAHGITGETK